MDSDPKKEEKRKPTPWYSHLKKNEGKKETDPNFNKEMSGKWYLVGLRGFTSIVGSTRAWCGLAVAVSLTSIGISYQKNGASAIAWDQYGTRIAWKSDGIPQGAIVRLNHNLNCSSSKGNHVALADGDCAPVDLMEMAKGSDGVWRFTGRVKKGATINLLGGNQGNMVKVSTYSALEICSVTWPKDYEKPPKITKSVSCSGKKTSNESTR